MHELLLVAGSAPAWKQCDALWNSLGRRRQAAKSKTTEADGFDIGLARVSAGFMRRVPGGIKRKRQVFEPSNLNRVCRPPRDANSPALRA